MIILTAKRAHKTKEMLAVLIKKRDFNSKNKKLLQTNENGILLKKTSKQTNNHLEAAAVAGAATYDLLSTLLVPLLLSLSLLATFMFLSPSFCGTIISYCGCFTVSFCFFARS